VLLRRITLGDDLEGSCADGEVCVCRQGDHRSPEEIDPKVEIVFERLPLPSGVSHHHGVVRVAMGHFVLQHISDEALAVGIFGQDLHPFRVVGHFEGSLADGPSSSGAQKNVISQNFQKMASAKQNISRHKIDQKFSS